jgi:hypothetical protein
MPCGGDIHVLDLGILAIPALTRAESCRPLRRKRTHFVEGHGFPSCRLQATCLEEVQEAETSLSTIRLSAAMLLRLIGSRPAPMAGWTLLRVRPLARPFLMRLTLFVDLVESQRDAIIDHLLDSKARMSAAVTGLLK